MPAVAIEQPRADAMGHGDSDRSRGRTQHPRDDEKTESLDPPQREEVRKRSNRRRRDRQVVAVVKHGEDVHEQR